MNLHMWMMWLGDNFNNVRTPSDGLYRLEIVCVTGQKLNFKAKTDRAYSE